MIDAKQAQKELTLMLMYLTRMAEKILLMVNCGILHGKAMILMC